METIKIGIGDCVTIKGHPRSKGEFIFVWDTFCRDNQEFLIINEPSFSRGDFIVISEEEKKERKLFQSCRYVGIRPYSLIFARHPYLGDSDFVKEIIISRKLDTENVGSCLRELFFFYLIDKCLDAEDVFDELYPAICAEVTGHPRYFLKNDLQNPLYKEKALEFQEILLLNIKVELGLFLVIKAQYNCVEIAKRIMLKPDYSLFQGLLEDRDLIETYSRLHSERKSYVTGTYHSTNSTEKRTIAHSLTTRFYDSIELDAKNHDALLNEQRRMEEKLQAQFEEAGYQGNQIFEGSKLNSFLFEDDIKKLQKILFFNFAKNIPIGKDLSDMENYNERLLIYLPAFQWFLPNIFTKEVPGQNASDLRKQHLRRIKDFLAGKI